MTPAELKAQGWPELDVLLISGDAYVDHPSFGAALIGRVLEAGGFRVGIIAQPDWRTPAALQLLGRPRLFCGVTAGNLDSMLANYTAARRHRQEDSYSEGGEPGRRPNHAAVVYAQLARQAFPGVPVILGGIEASLRRVAHYDFWDDQIRPSILVNTKAELLVYGMGENAIREVARRLAAGQKDLAGIPGTAYLLGAAASAAYLKPQDKPAKAGTPNGAPAKAGTPNFTESQIGALGDCVRLPDFEACRQDPKQILRLTKLVEAEQNPCCGRRQIQFHGDRAVVVEPPAMPLTETELDRVYELPFTRRPHPSYRREIPAFTMIKDSVTVVRGCAGGCSFCGLGLHQGKFIASRSQESILCELRKLAELETFKGTVSDLGGPTANLYGCENGGEVACQTCRRPSCLHPEICPHFKIAEKRYLELLRNARQTAGIKHVFIGSGLRMDVALRTPQLLRELVRHHTSGHLKVAPEHLHPAVLRRMRKSRPEVFERFRAAFETESRAAGKEQYLVPYFISNFPGCTEAEMAVVEDYLRRNHWNLQQVQDFIPLPMTPAAAMYVSGLDYATEEPIPVNRGLAARRPQLRAFRPGTPPRKAGGSRPR